MNKNNLNIGISAAFIAVLLYGSSKIYSSLFRAHEMEIALAKANRIHIGLLHYAEANNDLIPANVSSADKWFSEIRPFMPAKTYSPESQGIPTLNPKLVGIPLSKVKLDGQTILLTVSIPKNPDRIVECKLNSQYCSIELIHKPTSVDQK